MSDNTENKTENKKSAALTLQEEVAGILKDGSEHVKGKLRDLLVEREVSKRVDLLDKGMNKLRELKREVDKIRPPTVFNGVGEKVEGTFTKEEWQKKVQAKEKVAKLEKLLENAFAGQDFDKLSQMVSGKDAPTTNGEPSSD